MLIIDYISTDLRCVVLENIMKAAEEMSLDGTTAGIDLSDEMEVEETPENISEQVIANQ